MSTNTCGLVALTVLSLLLPAPAGGQAPAPGAGTRLFVLDVAGTPLGEIPAAIKQLKGMLEVVTKDGVPMLKASAVSEFLITLPQVLPQAFTLEFDLVPKACCNPQDLSFEGTPAINQGGGSSHVMWDSDGYLAVIGGGERYESPMPEELRTSLPGVLTSVVAVFEGTTVRLYTNGRRHYTLTDRSFPRGRVLRVFLGGQDDNTQAVYLAGMRIVAGAVPPTQVATNSSALSAGSLITASQGTLTTVSGGSTPAPGTPVGTPTPVQVSVPASSGATTTGPVTTQRPAPTAATAPTTASQSQASTGGALPTTVSSVSVTQGTAGPVVSWQPVSVPAVYSVKRWKIDDLICCNAASPPSPGLAAPPWQDAPLPVAGTYVYEVTATMSGGTASGQAQFVQLGAGGQIATATPPPIGPLPSSPPSSPTGGVSGSPALPVVHAPSGPATTAGPIAGTLPPALTVTAVEEPPPVVGYVRVTWTQLAIPHVINIRRWKSDDLNCCNLSSGPIGNAIAWSEPLLQSGTPTGTYIYEVTATTSTGSIVGRAQFTVGALVPPSPGGTISPTPMSSPTLTPPPTRGTVTPASNGAAPDVIISGSPAWTHLSWADLMFPGITYSVQRWLASDPTCCSTQVTGLTTRYWRDEGVQWPGMYIYRVTAHYPDGRAGFLDHQWVRPDPVNPANFRTAAISSGSVSLQWDAVLGASWYELSGPGVPNGSFQVVNTVFTVRGLAPGTYTWRIGTFYSSPNAPAPVSTAPAAFPQLTVVVP